MTAAEQLGDEVVRLSGRKGPQSAINGDYRVVKGQQCYFCRVNSMCIYFVGDKWVIGPEPPTESLLAIVDDTAMAPQEIMGIWHIWSGTMEPDPKIKIRKVEPLEYAPGSLKGVVVTSRYCKINGGYRRTEELCNGKSIFTNDENKAEVQYMWFQGDCWVIGPEVDGAGFYANSQATQGLPGDAQWAFEVKNVIVPHISCECEEGFVDNEFPPESMSIGKDVGACEWIRCSHLAPGEPKLYCKIDPGDCLCFVL